MPLTIHDKHHNRTVFEIVTYVREKQAFALCGASKYGTSGIIENKKVSQTANLLMKLILLNAEAMISDQSSARRSTFH